MRALVILTYLVVVYAQNSYISTAQVRQYLDASFARYDHSPKDGNVLENEWDETIYREDANNDTCVTLTEYLAVHSCPVAADLYNHYDHNGDGCLQIADMSQEFHLIDKSGDNVVSLHEWEQYFFHLAQKLLGHGR